MGKLGLRQKLSALQLNRKNGDSSDIFSKEELGQEPIKWLKYLVMDKLGLESIKKIETQIHRYKSNKVPDAIKLAQSIYSQKISNEQMTVVKVVPWNRGAQLQNYRIYRYEEIIPTFEKIKNDFGLLEHEIWLCESSVSNVGFNLGGRLTFPLFDKPNFVELVWFASPRMIESFSQAGFKYPYLRATRSSHWAEYKIELLYLPESYKSINLDEKILLEDFKKIVRLISLKRDTIKVLLEALGNFGAKEVSFCFKVVNGDLTIIDWDTEIESTN